MSPTEQQSLIETFCGWKRNPSKPGVWEHPESVQFNTVPPDYLTDLNACHDAETRFTDRQHKLFRDCL